MADYDNGAYFEDLDIFSEQIGAHFLFEPGVLTPLTELQPFFPDDESIGLDESYDTGIIFYYPTKIGATDTVTFRSQYFPLDHPDDMNQAIHKSGGGKLSVYGETYSDRVLMIRLDNVPVEKRQRLYIFLRNIVKMALRTFQYEDETGTLYTVKCIDKQIGWRMKFWLKYAVEVRLYVISKIDPS